MHFFYTLKQSLKRVIPELWVLRYHKFVALGASLLYRFPSRKLIVIGVTGTKGKSTTCNVLWHLLTSAGHTVGLATTVNFRVGAAEELNRLKMTMPGRFRLQKLLRLMVSAGCDIAIIETTSEGIKQWRHIGIHYDIVVFTNLSDEHLDAHGGFENYKNAKLALFRHLVSLPEKVINGNRIIKTSVINMDDLHASSFVAVGNTHKILVGSAANNTMVISNIQESLKETSFMINGIAMRMPLLGAWNVKNSALAIGVGKALAVSVEKLGASLQTLPQIPGRMERIEEGQPFVVIVDYAYEPLSLRLLYEFFHSKRVDSNAKMITLVSSTGGGRDVWRRQENGRVAGMLCDMVIVTNEDPYDEDPQVIIDEVAEGVHQTGKKEEEQFWCILDRRCAIVKAMTLAQPGDIVFLTAKGAEQKMCFDHGKKIDWDDRLVAREVLRNFTK